MKNTTIYKYELEVGASQVVELPEGAEINCVQAQHDKICIWAEVNPERPKEKHVVWVFGTGHDINEESKDKRYMGTVQMFEGSLVWHVYISGSFTNRIG